MAVRNAERGSAARPQLSRHPPLRTLGTWQRQTLLGHYYRKVRQRTRQIVESAIRLAEVGAVRAFDSSCRDWPLSSANRERNRDVPRLVAGTHTNEHTGTLVGAGRVDGLRDLGGLRH